MFVLGYLLRTHSTGGAKLATSVSTAGWFVLCIAERATRHVLWAIKVVQKRTAGSPGVYAMLNVDWKLQRHRTLKDKVCAIQLTFIYSIITSCVRTGSEQRLVR